MQETSYSKYTISGEIKKSEKLIERWKQELTKVQEELQKNKDGYSLLNELSERVSYGSITHITKENLTTLKFHISVLSKKVDILKRNIQSYTDYIGELNKIL